MIDPRPALLGFAVATLAACGGNDTQLVPDADSDSDGGACTLAQNGATCSANGECCSGACGVGGTCVPVGAAPPTASSSDVPVARRGKARNRRNSTSFPPYATPSISGAPRSTFHDMTVVHQRAAASKRTGQRSRTIGWRVVCH